MHGLAVNPGLPNSLDKAYNDRSCQLPSGTIHDQVDTGPSTILTQLRTLCWEYNY